MQNVWFTSDTHFCHKNIVRGTTTWTNPRGCRDFDTTEDHDKRIIESINGLVKPEDILYHLGDWSFGGHENIRKSRAAIKCKTIHLVLGNHDHHIAPLDSPYRSLFASVNQVSKLAFRKDHKFTKQKIFMSHYAHMVWENSSHGAIHLFGHSHGTLKNPIGKSMDVGVDTHDYYPYHLDEILEIMEGKPIEQIDHHNNKETPNEFHV